MQVTRRGFLTGLASAALGSIGPVEAATMLSSRALAYFTGTAEDNGVVYRLTNWKKINPKWRRQLVNYQSQEPQGSVVIDTDNHFLYVIFENQTALRYGVGVGRDGFRWFGRARIDRKSLWPRGRLSGWGTRLTDGTAVPSYVPAASWPARCRMTRLAPAWPTSNA